MDSLRCSFVITWVAIGLAGCRIPALPVFTDISDIVELPGIAVHVAGTYDWGFDIAELLFGTITFAQDGKTVTVTQTFHAAPGNRELTGQGRLEGNRLDVRMVPANGDTDYHADTSFLFSPDGERFRTDFSDTNGDAGTAWGQRR